MGEGQDYRIPRAKNHIRPPGERTDEPTPKPRLRHLQETGHPLFLTFGTKGLLLSPAARRCVVAAGRYYDGDRYDLYEVVCVPDHVHLVLKPMQDPCGSEVPLARIVHGIKSYTAHRINDLMRRSGPVWQRGYYDRIVRTERDFGEKLR